MTFITRKKGRSPRHFGGKPKGNSGHFRNLYNFMVLIKVSLYFKLVTFLFIQESLGVILGFIAMVGVIGVHTNDVRNG